MVCAEASNVFLMARGCDLEANVVVAVFANLRLTSFLSPGSVFLLFFLYRTCIYMLMYSDYLLC